MVFVLDGVLIGARDTRHLMWTMLAGAAILIAGAWSSLQFDWALMGILSAISAMMLWRSTTNLGRFFKQKWVVGESVDPRRLLMIASAQVIEKNGLQAFE